jgi:hypothetical protein
MVKQGRRERPTVKLFVEGGGNDNHALNIECRRAFSTLLEKAGLAGHMPRIVACGGRRDAFNQFRHALQKGEQVILLVDAEAPVQGTSPWAHVKQRGGDDWEPPTGATDDHLHLMVQVMESWFLADRAALRIFYGAGFLESALPSPATPIESVGKDEVFATLKAATRPTKTKGEYGKGSHSFKVLATLNAQLICQCSPAAARFFEAMRAKMTAQ